MSRRQRGSIATRTLADGRTAYDVRVLFPPDEHGQRKRYTRTVYDPAEADKLLTAWQRELDQGIAVKPTADTVAALLRRWLEEDAATRVRPTTLTDYRATIDNHLIPRIGGKKLQAITPADVSAFRARLVKETGTRTAQLALLRLKQALTWAVALELLPRNVAAGIKPPAGKAPEQRALTHAEARQFLDYARSDTYWPLWLVYLSTGLRRGEALGLRWRDLDLERGILSVRQSVGLGE